MANDQFKNVSSGSSSTAAPETVIFEYEAPNGDILEWEGPETTPKDQLKAHFEGYLKSHQPPDDRSAGQVALDQAGNVVKGAVGAVTGIPSMLGDLANVAKGFITQPANPENFTRGKDLLNRVGEGAAQMFAQPLDTVYNMPDPSSPDWKTAAQNSGAQGANLALGEGVARGAGAVGRITPESLMERAASIRPEPVPASSGIPLTKHGALVEAAKTAVRGGRNVVASGLEKTATALAKNQTSPAGGAVIPALDPFSPEAIRSQPYEPPVQTPAVEHGFGGQVRNMQPAAPPDSPYISDYLTDQQYPPRGMDAAQPAPAFEQGPIPQRQPSPMDLDNQAWLQQQQPPPQPMVPRNPNADMLRSQLRKNDAAARWANANADKVYELMPELRGLAPGSEAFRVQATNAFKNMEHAMKAAQDSVPPQTVVPTLEMKQALGEIQNQVENVSANLPAKAKLALEINKLNKPVLSWKEFLTLKDEFRKIPNFMRDPYLKQAYGVYMDAASKAGGPELALANKNFSTVMNLNKHAGIDMSWGDGQGQPLR